MRKRIRGCLIGGIFLILALTAVCVDVRMTGKADALYCPEDAEWIAVVSDLPKMAERALRTSAFEALNEQAPDYWAKFQLSVRRDVGIRPTPLRWRVWLGRQFAGAVSPDGAGACVRPGVLLRVADAVRGLGGWRPAVRKFGPYYYGWREGALIFSRSEKYVLASLEAAPFRPPYMPYRPVLSLYEGRDALSAIRVWSSSVDIGCEGWIEPCSEAARPLQPELTLLPLDSAIAWAAAPRMRNLRELGAAVGEMVTRHTAVEERPWYLLASRLVKQAAAFDLFDGLPNDWDPNVQGSLVTLLDIDTSEALPVPEIGAVFQAAGDAAAPHPLEPLTRDGPAIPYEWDGQPGVMAPRAGEKATLCLSSAGQFWLAASQEPAMARLVRAAQNPRGQAKELIGEFAVVEVNWTAAASKAEALARQAAKFELLPHMNAEDLEAKVLPLLRALGSQGRARLDFTPSDDGRRLEFHGSLTSEAEP